MTVGDVVAAVQRGLERGEKAFGIKARQILSTIRGLGHRAEVVW